MSNKSFPTVVLMSLLYLTGCGRAQTVEAVLPGSNSSKPVETLTRIRNSGRVVHVLVALCDNEFQGIVPVPAHLGNGEDPDRNLYWGAAYGVKTFFSRSKSWQKVGEFRDPKPDVLERIIFKHRTQDVYLVADAYRGSRIRKTIDDFFSAASGNEVENLDVDRRTLQVLGSSNLIAFIGHNGLMDFKLEKSPAKHDDEKRDAVILACASRNYFSKHLKNTGASPLVWTSNLMAPEAYTLHEALEGWIRDESPQQIRVRAASAYARYQKISQKSAENLIVTGW